MVFDWLVLKWLNVDPVYFFYTEWNISGVNATDSEVRALILFTLANASLRSAIAFT